MLLEHINYHNDLPFSIGFSNIAQENPHYHKEMEMTLLLRGTGSYKIHHQNYLLNAGDVIIVDTEDLHRIYDSSEDAIMLTMYVNLEYFNELYPNIDFMIFACEECGKESAARHQELQNKVSFLRHYLAEIMMLSTTDKANDQLLMEKIHQFIFIMVNQFQGFFIEDNQFKTNRNEINSIDLNRLYRIIKYIYLNYDKKITLDDLAQLEHLSPYYVSHLIKETSGLSFQSFLNYVRVEYAEKFLVENKFTLTQISELCGFSTSSYFNKCFQAWHRLTPGQYRKKLPPCQRSSHQPFSQDEAFSLLKPYLNTYRKIQRDKNILKHSSHHIFIPVKPEYSGGKDFQRQFPLHIIAGSVSDLLRLASHAQTLLSLKPASIKIAESILNELPNGRQILTELRTFGIDVAIQNRMFRPRKTPADTVTKAFGAVLENPSAPISLFNDRCALFTPEGLPSPYFSLYRLFSDIDGSIVEMRDQYLTARNQETVFMLLSQIESNFKLNAHLQFHSINGGRFIVKRIFSKQHSVDAALKALNNPQEIDARLKEHILHTASGATQFSYIKNEIEPKLDLIIEPGMFVLLEITDTIEA